MSKHTLRNRLACVIALSLFVPQTARAYWSDELTTHLWDSSDVDVYGTADCGIDDWNNGALVPGRTAGGWFEHRFMTSGFGTFTSLRSNVTSGVNNDRTRVCPKTFNEYTATHNHGVTAARLAVYNGNVYAAYDSSGGYYGGNAIILAKDPSALNAPGNRPFGFELFRNARNYMRRTGITSQTAAARFDANFDGAFDASVDGCDKLDNNPSFDNDGVLGTINGKRFDPNWLSHYGYDHEKTFCAPHAQLQTFDPDIEFKQNLGMGYVTWVERYVDGRTPAAPNGFDPLFPLPSNEPVYRPLRVHVERIDLASLENNALVSTPLTPNEQGLNVDSGEINGTYSQQRSAISPRITVPTQTSNLCIVGRSCWNVTRDYPTVAWIEAQFDTLNDRSKTFGLWQAANHPSREGWLYVKQYNGSAWDLLGGTAVGRACNIQETSSGRATGHKRIYGGAHDIATMVWGGLERPVVAAMLKNGTACELQVKVWTGSQWQAIGNSLETTQAYDVAWPRLTVFKNAPFVTYASNAKTSAQWSALKVAKWNAPYARWDNLGWGLWAQSQEKARYVGPSIVVHGATQLNSTNDDGEIIYVTAAAHEPSGAVTYDGKDGAWATTTRRCRTMMNQYGAWECILSNWGPELFTEPQTKFDASRDLPVYNRSEILGHAWGSRVKTVPATPAAYPGVTLDAQLSGFERDQWGAYQGCYVDSATRALDVDIGYSGYTPDTCRAAAAALGLKYAGLQVGGECRGGNRLEYQRVRDSECNQPCTADTSKKCGAGWRNSVYLSADAIALPAATDMALVGSDQNEQPTMFASWVGPVQNHREFDDGLFVKKHAPALGQQAMFGSGLNFSVFYPGTGVYVYTKGANDYGQLGNGNTTASSSWQSVYVGEQVVKVSAGYLSAGVLTASGRVLLWGNNGWGQNCSGTVAAAVTAPTAVAGISAIDFGVGAWHTSILRNDGTVWSCGYGGEGALGTGTTSGTAFTSLQQAQWPGTGAPFYLPPSALTGVIRVEAGVNYTCAVTNRGYVACWGMNSNGQLGVGNTTAYSYWPQWVRKNATDLLTGVQRVAPGWYHTLALGMDGTQLWGWGYNGVGQLGTGDGASRLYATNIFNSTMPQKVDDFTANNYASAMRIGTNLWTFGYNNVGQLARADVSAQYYWAIPPGGTNVVALRGNGGAGNHFFAAKSEDKKRESNTYYCWGGNASGQCGVMSFASAITGMMPIQVPSQSLLRYATQSSCSTGCWGGIPSRAADGMLDGNFWNGSVSHTNYDAGAWWQVDLNALRSVSRIDIYNRTDDGASRVRDIEVQISSDGLSWTTYYDPGRFGIVRPVQLKPGSAARYVRVRLANGRADYLNLTEVLVW